MSRKFVLGNLTIRKPIKLGGSMALTFPKDWLPSTTFVVIEKRDGELVIKALEY